MTRVVLACCLLLLGPVAPSGKDHVSVWRPKLGAGVLDRFQRGERTYSLTRTELVERLSTAAGQTTGHTPLSTTLGDGARIVDVDESGTAILSIPGRGAVVLHCLGSEGFQEEERPCK